MERIYGRTNVAAIMGQKKDSPALPCWNIPGPRTPALDTSYIVPPWVVANVARWLSGTLSVHDNLWVSGPTGCGKSSGIRWLAAKLNVELFEVTAHGRMELADLTGQWVMSSPDGGKTPPSMQWMDGPMIAAMRCGGWLLIDEADMLDPAVAVGLNGMLDGAPVTIAEHGGELVVPHPGYRCIVCANTSGTGDDTGLYAGTLRHNIALMDRWTSIVADYAPESVEKPLLKAAAPSLPDDIIVQILKIASDIRRAYVGDPVEGIQGTLDATMSIRTTLRWVRAIEQYASTKIKSPLVAALDVAFCNRLSRSTKASVYTIVQRHTGIALNGNA